MDVYDSEHIVMVNLSQRDKDNISNMSKDATTYAVYDDSLSVEEVTKRIDAFKEDVQKQTDKEDVKEAISYKPMTSEERSSKALDIIITHAYAGLLYKGEDDKLEEQIKRLEGALRVIHLTAVNALDINKKQNQTDQEGSDYS